MSKHTPTPYHIVTPAPDTAAGQRDDRAIAAVVDGKVAIIGELWEDCPMQGVGQRMIEHYHPDTQANARFIVRACNNFEPLLQAATDFARAWGRPVSVVDREANALVELVAKLREGEGGDDDQA